MTKARLQELFGRFADLHITVAGDLFIDRWWEIDESLNEPSIETGLTAYQIVKKRSAAGAAGASPAAMAAMAAKRSMAFMEGRGLVAWREGLPLARRLASPPRSGQCHMLHFPIRIY